MSHNKLRPVDPYDEGTDGTFLYRLGHIAVLVGVALAILLIDTYVGWWNLFIGIGVLCGLGLVVAVKLYPHFPELHFTSLDDRPYRGDVYAYEYDVDEDELNEVQAIFEQPTPVVLAVDPTEQAEVLLWRLLFLAIPGFMFFGWLQPGSTLTLSVVIMSAIVAVPAYWLWSLLLGIDDHD